MMWTMGYNDGVDSVNNNQDPLCTGHKLRQLLPRPITTHAHFQALNHYHLAMAEQNRRDLVSTRQVVASSRWNPTPDQLHALEELYRRGTRSPSTDQIQQIAAQLRRYGQIEGKNVFYWFQNHKSRERQKRRRQFELTPGEKQPHYHINGDENGENRDSSAVANKTPHEVEQAKNRTTESGTTAHQKTLSRQGTAKAECKAAADHGWVGYFDTINDAELLQQRKNATWHTMQFSCNSSDPTNLLNSCSSAMTVSTISTTIPSTFVISTSSSTEIMTTIKPQESINNIIFLEPHNISSQRIDDEHHYEAQTLQLFPVRSTNEKCVDEEEEDERDSAMNSGTSCSYASNCQFFEFLPIKNC